MDRDVGGFTAPGFEPVAAAFRANFARGRELGAACAAYHRGEPVVDLWGGHRDVRRRTAWERDTMVLVFSATKGLAALATAVAHSRGLFALDDAVADHWPEFAQNGKAGITVRQLLSHQAGLSFVAQRLGPDNMGDLDFVARAIAAQAPAWQPGTNRGYHAMSFGWYAGELIRRVDPGHRSLGRFFREEIAAPLGIDFFIGLPAEVPDRRLAELQSFHPLRALLHLHELPLRLVLAYAWPWSLAVRSFTNPRLRRHCDWNRRECLSLEFPSIGGVGEARAIAKAYGVFACGGAELGIAPETMAALKTAPRWPAGVRDRVVGIDTSFSLGFMKPCRATPFGADDRAFGMPGLGGTFGYADPALELGFAYATNRMGFRVFGDPREAAVRRACHDCAAALRR